MTIFPSEGSMSFSDLERELKEAPATWVPALLRALVQRAEAARVFQEDGLVLFVKNALALARGQNET